MCIDRGKLEVLKKTKKDYQWATVLLGALVAAPTIVSFIQSGFEIELRSVFEDLVAFYRRAMTPFADLVQWPFRSLSAMLGVNLEVPQWVKDLHVLSFALAGVYVRGWGWGKSSALMNIDILLEHSLPPTTDGENTSWDQLQAARKHYGGWLSRGTRALSQSLAALLIGFTGAGLFIWVLVVVEMFRAMRNKWKDDQLPDLERITRTRRFLLFLRVGAATGAAVVIFFIGNALGPP